MPEPVVEAVPDVELVSLEEAEPAAADDNVVDRFLKQEIEAKRKPATQVLYRDLWDAAGNKISELIWDMNHAYALNADLGIS